MATPLLPMALRPETLAALRIALGYSQSALARKSGVSQSHISDIEKGSTTAAPEIIHKLARALGVTVGALVTLYDAETVREAAKILGLTPEDVFPQPEHVSAAS